MTAFVAPAAGSFVRCLTTTTAQTSRTTWRTSRIRATPRMAQASEGRSSRVIGGPYKGVYGDWLLTQGDADGVLIYRSALLISAASAALGVTGAYFGATGTILDSLFALHTAAFGVALATIHIYMRPMHNALKALYAAGVIGAGVLLATGAGGDAGLVMTVVERPALLLAVGWQFVALTGVFFKESVCFGRVEALALTALLPVLAGGRFLGIVGGTAGEAALVAFVAGYLFFAIRKFGMEAKADLGDLSVFQHIEKQEAL